MSAFDSLERIGSRVMIGPVREISEAEFERICSGIAADRETIIKHNPIGSDDEIILWMLLSCLNSYLSLTEQETPCFTARPDVSTYRMAILSVLRGKCKPGFDPGPYIDNLLEA
jgi:hypothetical protein